MDVFSLEEEEGNELFLTQETKESVSNDREKVHSQESDFLGLNVMDFQSPCVSLVQTKQDYQQEYSDISDVEFEDKGDENQLEQR